jgi:hypothetical protein
MGAKVHISLQKKECFQPAFRTEPLLAYGSMKPVTLITFNADERPYITDDTNNTQYY